MPGTESFWATWAHGYSGQGLVPGLWSLSSAPQLHSMKTQQEEQEKQQPFSFTLGDLLVSISFHEFLVQLTALKTKAAAVILFSRSECYVLWDSLCVTHWKIVILTKNQALHFMPEQNLCTWKYLEQKFQMLLSGVLLWVFLLSIKFLIYYRESHWKHRNIFSKQRKKLTKIQSYQYMRIWDISSADNAVSDTLSNAGNIECCIKIL